ncbi:MAG: hypothetical protein DWP92_02730 [Armatimonadetes bacterium]|nr:MAG: hypothetical protein DWP92_02730 [Armatimonadota bacterium]
MATALALAGVAIVVECASIIFRHRTMWIPLDQFKREPLMQEPILFALVFYVIFAIGPALIAVAYLIVGGASNRVEGRAG